MGVFIQLTVLTVLQTHTKLVLFARPRVPMETKKPKWLTVPVTRPNEPVHSKTSDQPVAQAQMKTEHVMMSSGNPPPTRLFLSTAEHLEGSPPPPPERPPWGTTANG